MNRKVTPAEFKALALHFSNLAAKLDKIGERLEEVGHEFVEVEANQLFNTYKTNVKKAVDSVCRVATVKIDQKIEEEEERAEAEAVAAVASKKAPKKK